MSKWMNMNHGLHNFPLKGEHGSAQGFNPGLVMCFIAMCPEGAPEFNSPYPIELIRQQHRFSRALSGRIRGGANTQGENPGLLKSAPLSGENRHTRRLMLIPRNLDVRACTFHSVGGATTKSYSWSSSEPKLCSQNTKPLHQRAAN